MLKMLLKVSGDIRLSVGMDQYICSVLVMADIGYRQIRRHSPIPVVDNNLLCLINLAQATFAVLPPALILADILHLVFVFR